MGVLDANFVEECSPGVTLSVVALLETNNDVEVDANGLIVIAHGAGQRLHLSRLETLKRRALQGCQDIKDILNRSVKDHLTANLLPSFLHSSLK
jgi:exosome complex component RRP41